MNDKLYKCTACPAVLRGRDELSYHTEMWHKPNGATSSHVNDMIFEYNTPLTTDGVNNFIREAFQRGLQIGMMSKDQYGNLG